MPQQPGMPQQGAYPQLPGMYPQPGMQQPGAQPAGKTSALRIAMFVVGGLLLCGFLFFGYFSFANFGSARRLADSPEIRRHGRSAGFVVEMVENKAKKQGMMAAGFGVAAMVCFGIGFVAGRKK